MFPDLRNKSREEIQEMVRQEMEVLNELARSPQQKRWVVATTDPQGVRSGV